MAEDLRSSMMQPDAGLMPLPRVLRWLEGPVLPAGTPLAVRHAQVETTRITVAVARWMAGWDAPGGSSPARNEGGTQGGTQGGSGLPTAIVPGQDRGRETAPTRAVLVVDCAAAGNRLPALGDDESYRIEIGADRILLAAPLEWGILRGLATLTQLAVANAGLPQLAIEDAPRFPWRGLMLDPARHFIGAGKLMTTLDAMALYKLNVLHLHLTDDQGFRFPSRAYPRLASPQAYTLEELERLVAHAADLGIRVVPEIDMPGHTTSWLTAYPDWGCRPAEPSRRFGVHKGCLDPTNPAVHAAVETLLAEVAGVFPDAYLHIGGDEVHPEWWLTTESVQAFMAANGIATPGDLQADFNRRVVERVTALGRRTIGWDEVLHPQLPAAVTVQSWRGATARDRALGAGHDCVVSANYYLDLFFAADVHYRFDPEAPEQALVAREDELGDDPRLAHVAAGMRWTRQWRDVEAAGPARGDGRVLGAEACLWSELVDEATLDIRLWGRMPALAERFWSAAEVADVVDMRRRLRGSLMVLARSGIDVEAQSSAFVARAGVQAAWQPLVRQLEPVKWYARLLGADALAARLAGREMPLSRPYQADTPLDRVADGLLPESFAALDLQELCREAATGQPGAAARLRALAETWRALPLRNSGPAELEPLAQRLVDCGQILIDLFDDRITRAVAAERLAPAARPAGEYLLATVPVLLDWLSGPAP